MTDREPSTPSLPLPSTASLPRLAALGGLFLLAACAQTGTPGAGEASATAASSAGAAASGVATAASGPARPASGAAAAPAPGQPPAFATVIKDAQKIDGAFTLWRKDEKVWMELAEKDFGAPLFLSPKLASGIGEGPMLGGLMASRGAPYGRPQLVDFRKVYQQVQLIARNTAFVAREGTPEARAVRSSFSASLIASTALASQPHPERKTVLIEVSSLLAGDLLGLGQTLQRTYRQGYGYDGRNSSLLSARSKPESVEFELLNHYAAPSIAVPTPGGPPGAPQPSTPSTLPDVRSLFVAVHYSLARLPEQPMAPRAADARIGTFRTLVSDFGNDLERSPKRRYVNRWRLEKKDPAAALSEPVRPIIYWVDPSVPEKYRASITAGILEWNRAFEKIGFKDAVVVKQMDDKSEFDSLDIGVASVRWITNAQPSFGAIGPSHVDPRSGEILDADIAFESLSSRNLRAARSQILPVRSHPGLAFTASGAAPIQAQTQAHWAGLMQAADLQAELGLGRAVAGQAASGHEAEFCDHADQAAEGLAYGLDLLEARGELDPGGPEAEAFVQAYMKDVAMHEVGHTLGLRHNFRASRIYSDAQVSDPEFGRSHALSGSVMEYLPVNLPRPGDKPTAPFQTTLGPYDYWAIEYAYKPVAAELEKSELERIAARSGEPELAFATDEDNFLGVDPESLHFDLGDDPVAFATKRLAIAQDLLKRLEKREFDPGDDFGVLRRSLTYMLRDLARSSGVLARQIGGVRTLRDRANTLRDPLEPVPASRQRAALDALARGLLSPDALAFSAGLQRRLGPDFLEREDALFEGGAMPPTDFVPAQVVLELQTTLLGQLMSDGVAVRLIDSEAKFDRQQPGADAPLRVSELWGRLQREVWGELAAGREIPALRRELQRDHVNRMAALLLNPGRLSRGDTRALLRAQASDLQTRLAAAAKRSDWNEETRAHLRDCGETLREALSARLNRSGL